MHISSSTLDTVNPSADLGLVAPNLHRIHHSSWQPETDSNFSAVFPIWDIIFGTFRPRSWELQATMDLGLEEIRDRRVHQPI